MEEDVTEREKWIRANPDKWFEQMRAHLKTSAAAYDALRERLTKFTEESNKRGAAVDERIANLTILVNELVKKDLNGH